jgi:hypothetical protein
MLAVIAALMLAAADPGAAPPPPPPDPREWWADRRPRPTAEQDPLGGRRVRRGEQIIPMEPGIEPLLYRLWGLPPLQTQLVRRNEAVIELWTRPSEGVRQAVIRVTVRGDGRTFVQIRAGLGCCTPEIARRIGVDAELPSGSAARFRALAALPVWNDARVVSVDFGDGAVQGLCVAGVAYDLTLVVPGRARHLHRFCESEAVGEVADVLEPMIAAALGRDPRFDLLFPLGSDFRRERTAYQRLIAQGGRLARVSNSPDQPVIAPEPPPEEEVPPPAEPAQAEGAPAAGAAADEADMSTRPAR